MRGYPASSSMPGRVRAMGSALLLGGRLRRELGLDELDAIHFPLSVMLPLVSSPPAATTILDLQHEFLPENFSALGAGVPACALRRERAQVADRDRDLGARPGDARRAAVARARPRAHDPPRRRPRALLAGRRAARAVPLLPGERLAAQEPRAAVRGGRAAAARAPRPAARADGRPRRRPRLRGRSRSRVAGRARRALPPRVRARLPEPLRRLRPAGARGARVRVPRGVLRPAAAPRGRGRRGGLLRPARPRVDRGGGARGDRARRVVRAPSARRRFTWDECARKHDAVYRELAT